MVSYFENKISPLKPFASIPCGGYFLYIAIKITLPMARLYFILLLFVCLITIVFPLPAQPPIQVGKEFKEELLSRQTELLEDASKSLTIQNVLTQQSLFKPNAKPFINPGFTNSYYWVRFQLTNPDSVRKDLILEVENPHINKLQLFTVSGKQVSAGILTGDHFPFAQRPVKHPHFLFPISVPPSQTLTFYLWTDKHGEQLQIPLRLWEKDHFSTKGYILFLFIGLLLGITSLYCLISFFTYYFLSSKNHLLLLDIHHCRMAFFGCSYRTWVSTVLERIYLVD